MMIEDEGRTPQRVVGLVIHLLREIREQRLDVEEMDLLSEDLIVQGYTESEIDAAFSWVVDRIGEADPSEVLYTASAASGSYRVLHPAERAVMSTEAYGQLLEMCSLAIIGMEDLEKIIDRAMTLGGPLGSDEIMMIAHAYMFEEGGRGAANAYNLTTPPRTVH